MRTLGRLICTKCFSAVASYVEACQCLKLWNRIASTFDSEKSTCDSDVRKADNSAKWSGARRPSTRIFGYTAEEVAGQWLPELIIPDELRAEALKNRDALISGKRVELEAIRQGKGGVRFDVSVVAKGISLGFELVGVYFSSRSIGMILLRQFPSWLS